MVAGLFYLVPYVSLVSAQPPHQPGRLSAAPWPRLTPSSFDGAAMSRFTNDNVDYVTDGRGDTEKAQLMRLEEVVRRIEALQKELAILEEARMALRKSLKQEP
jgi:hypothetical protein